MLRFRSALDRKEKVDYRTSTKMNTWRFILLKYMYDYTNYSSDFCCVVKAPLKFSSSNKSRHSDTKSLPPNFL